MNNSIKSYGLERARKYDEESKIVRGNRELQKLYLSDLLQYLRSVNSFVELGCGTGYFTEVIFQVFPDITGIVIDGSEEMLQMARKRFEGENRKITFQNSLFENIDWKSITVKPDMVFSALAIHHLEDSHKFRLFERIFSCLTAGGAFILFDSFKLDNGETDELLEYLSCKDIQRRIKIAQSSDIPVEQIIEKDREIKKGEGDKEISLSECINGLKNIGFVNVATVFQENRYAGVIARKEK